MAFRIIKVDSRCKLETQLNYLVCRKEKETRIPIDEISMIIIESQQVCFTQALITTLIQHNVRVIFCDEKHQPLGEVLPYVPTKSSYLKVDSQIKWTQEFKDLVWKSIVKQKIRNQADLLKRRNMDEPYKLLMKYVDEVEQGDVTNREGLAAKVYFSALFGSDFDRRSPKDIRNTYLDYGYSLILGAINRSIAACGYLTQVGIHHIGKTNPYNLGCDLMEPFRPFIDEIVSLGRINESTYKAELISSLGKTIICNSQRTLMDNAIYDYTVSVLSALSNGSIPCILRVEFENE